MHQKTVVVLNLLQEIDQCCRDNNISYCCGGLFASALVQKKDLIIQQGAIYVDVNDISRLVELLGNNDKENREIELANGTNYYPSFSARYIDSATTFINNRTILSYEKPGIYIEILPVIHSDPDEGNEQSGLLFGDKRIKANNFYAAVDSFKRERNETTHSYIQDATGEIKSFDDSLLQETETRFFNGYELQISRDIDTLFDVLYRKKGGIIKYPSFPLVDNIISAEVSYKDILNQIDDYEEWGSAIDSKLSIIDELNDRIDQREEKIQGILDEVRELYIDN